MIYWSEMSDDVIDVGIVRSPGNVLSIGEDQCLRHHLELMVGGSQPTATTIFHLSFSSGISRRVRTLWDEPGLIDSSILWIPSVNVVSTWDTTHGPDFATTNHFSQYVLFTSLCTFTISTCWYYDTFMIWRYYFLFSMIRKKSEVFFFLLHISIYIPSSTVILLLTHVGFFSSRGVVSFCFPPSVPTKF